jgi:putative transposon-encoded protein
VYKKNIGHFGNTAKVENVNKYLEKISKYL